MKPDKPEPLLRTPQDQLNKVERYKLAANYARGQLHEHFRDLTDDSVVDETEQIAKSHGIYLEYNRAKTGREKDWMYMVRVSIPGGGSFNQRQWQIFDDLASKYTANLLGQPSLRVTTRQNIQFHWVKKPYLVEIVKQIAETGFFTLNGCGDNIRNIMGCPLSTFSTVYDANAMSRKFAEYFRLPAEPHIKVFEIDTSLIRTPEQHFEYTPHLLNRKFKIAFSAVHRDIPTGQWHPDNCVELRTNEIGVAPIVENDTVAAFQVYIGGGQGEKNGKPTFAALGKPFGVFVESELLNGLDAITQVQQEWGDRQNRHWARMKYVVQAQGISWFRQQVRDRGAIFDSPLPHFDPGPRHLHHGWHQQPSNGLLAYGAYIENGRIIDAGPNGDLKKMVRHLMDHYPIAMMTTPNQDLLFTNIPPDAKERFEQDMADFGYGKRNNQPYSRLRLLSGACVGLDTCRLAYTESEQFEPELVDELEKRGYGDIKESIGITGCERQCFRPATKTIGWIGQGPNLYALKLGGSEAAAHQGRYLADNEHWYLRQVPRQQVADVTAVLFEFYKHNRHSESEDMGAFHHRIGATSIISHLKQRPATAPLMKRTKDAPYVPTGGD